MCFVVLHAITLIYLLNKTVCNLLLKIALRLIKVASDLILRLII